MSAIKSDSVEWCVFQVFLISLHKQGPEVALRQNLVLPIEESNLRVPTIQLVDCTKIHWRPYQFKSRVNPAPYSELDSNEEAADKGWSQATSTQPWTPHSSSSDHSGEGRWPTQKLAGIHRHRRPKMGQSNQPQLFLRGNICKKRGDFY
jgi:hypothetical protein